MKSHIGITLSSYDKDKHGRVCRSPLLHHPDLCPYYGPDERGECMRYCSNRTSFQRPCNSGERAHLIPKADTDLIGYIVNTKKGMWSAPTENDDLRQEFWCLICITPLNGDSVPAHLIPVHRISIGIYSQVCNACGHLLVDGVKKIANGTDPLCLFGLTAGGK